MMESCNSMDNPADIASRGTSMSSLADNQMWWSGPKWLQTEEIPYSKEELESTNLEKRKNVNTKTQDGEIYKGFNFETFDTLNELRRCIVYAKRFLNSKKNPHCEFSITTQELEDALKTCVKLVQREEFADEIDSLVANKPVRNNSLLLCLNPYLDSKNLIRVGGRLRHANLPETTKHPIILGNKNGFVDLIIADAHKRTLHG